MINQRYSKFPNMKLNPVIIYLHIPKVGGSTLEKIIYSHLHLDKTNIVDSFGDGFHLIYSGIYHFKPNISAGFFKEENFCVPDKIKMILSREDLRAVLGHCWFGIHEYISKPSIYITLLRNPIERIVSLYHHLINWPWVKDWESKSSEGMTLEEFVIKAPYSEIDNDQTRRISGLDPDIGKCTKATLKVAKENLRKHFSLVGVTERFNETLILLKRNLGWEQEILYYPKLVNKNRPSASSLPKQTLDAIRERNELDIELYEFANSLLDEAIALQDSSFDDELQAFESSLQSQSWYTEAMAKK